MTNYNAEMKKIIASLDHKPRLLLHACCAPCSVSALEKVANFFDITLYYYNPNIGTKEEYDLRLAQFEKLKSRFHFTLVAEDYVHGDFLDKCSSMCDDAEGGQRCRTCVAMRIKKTFDYAVGKGYDYVCTTLTSSPLKDAEYINNVGITLSKEYGINYLVADFKKKNGVLNSINICKDLGIYRQHYCGCEFAKAKM
ncbi:MAG: epoxyqueuosine reductase QueH [Clostridia bacterium]